MPRKNKRVPSKYSIDLALPTVQHSAGAHHLLSSFLKHLAFAREQCHAPFAELQKQYQACQQLQHQQQLGRRKRLKSASRKAIKYHDKFCSLMQLVSQIPFPSLPGTAVVVLLGPSVLRPREVYTLHFPAASSDPTDAELPSERQLGEASRKFLRTLIMQHGNITEWDSTPGPTKMFVLFSAPEGCLQEVPEGFVIKRGFRLNLSRAFQVSIELGPTRPAAPEAVDMDCDDKHEQYHHHQQQQQQTLGVEEDAELEHLSQQMNLQMQITDTVSKSVEEISLPREVWHQCVVHVRGLKSASSA